MRGLAGLMPVLLALACSSAYYATMERVGVHKRDILVDRVRAGQTDQEQAEEQFLSAYEVLKELSSFEGGDLENLYGRLNREFERSEARASDVRERIGSIERVAGDLFEEWEAEIGVISSAELRRQSRARMRATQERYAELIRAMRRAESRMDPVLTAFRDQVLFLKHNLNARAVASLSGVAVEVQADIDRLIEDMRRSIREAESFVRELEG